MRQKFIALCLITMAGSAYAAGCSDGTPQRPFEAEAQRFRLMLARGQFDELERWAQKSEDAAQRIADGQSLRSALFAGVRISLDCTGPMDTQMMMAAEGFRARAAEWASRYPGSREAQLAVAMAPLSMAWAVRGDGGASEMSPEAFAAFNENLADARKKLEALAPGVRDDPAWHAAMLEILKLQSAADGDFERELREAVAHYPDYEMIWFQAGSYYSPKWGGTAARLRALAERAAAATQARMGETMYTRVQWSSSDSAMFRSGQADWSRMKQGFERLLRDYPDNWNANNFASFACRAHDSDGLRKAFAHIEKPVPAVWGMGGLYDTCKSHANDGIAAAPVSR